MMIHKTLEEVERAIEMREEISYKNIEEVKAVLGREISQIEFENLWIDWNEFTRNPLKYAGTVVIDMVNQYLDE